MHKVLLGHCVLLLLGLITLTWGQQLQNLDKSHEKEFYRHEDTSSPIQYLPNGDSEYARLSLYTPLHFYDRQYKEIFINTNGILTFESAFPEYSSILKVPSIAVFYSNVDTTNANSSTSIYLFESQVPEQLNRANNLVHFAFPEKSNFRAKKLIVATWKNVGYFRLKTDRLNTFQAILIVNGDDTFVQFIYPKNGLNWIRAERTRRLPDKCAQVAFVIDFNRNYQLEGSATNKARLLSLKSNVGIEGVWLHHVGALANDENVTSPTNPYIYPIQIDNLQTCSEIGITCDVYSTCFDKSGGGICCACQEGYYGNGINCFKNEDSAETKGDIVGEINNNVIKMYSQFFGFANSSVGWSLTRVFTVTPELHSRLSLAFPIFTIMGWLFAKPKNGALNGFQLTGGNLFHFSKIRFDTGEVLEVNQTFTFLNYTDQLTEKVTLSGHVPYVAPGTKFRMADYIEEYRFVSPNEMISTHAHTLEIPDGKRVIKCQVEKTLRFDRCQLDKDQDLIGTKLFLKVSNIKIQYVHVSRDTRLEAINEIDIKADTNPCTDGRAVCGRNTLCVPHQGTYRCECLKGFSSQEGNKGQQVCRDINECEFNTSVCDKNAFCSNNEGSFSCTCSQGFIGNGFKCVIDNDNNSISSSVKLNETEGKNLYQQILNSENYNECQLCSPDADCINGRCQCHNGFSGDGYSCSYKCGHKKKWDNGLCLTVLINLPDTDAECDSFGRCKCPEGYELLEYTHVCRYIATY